jgi:hypothetical protein
MPVRNLRTLIAAAFFLSVIGCSSQNEATSPALPTVLSPSSLQAGSGVTAEICKNNLLPVVQGATWTYLTTGGPNGDFTYSDTITETRTDGFTLTSQFPSLSLTQDWICSSEGLIARQLGGGTTASVSMQNMITNFKTLEVSGLSIPANITPGMQWKYNLLMEGSVAMPGENTQSPGTFNLTMQEMGRESVTVPAGNFEAIKLQATFEAQIDVDFQGSPVPYTVHGSSIVWYAPDVGFIKSIENIDFSGTSFTSNTELQAYNLP